MTHKHTHTRNNAVIIFRFAEKLDYKLSIFARKFDYKTSIFAEMLIRVQIGNTVNGHKVMIKLPMDYVCSCSLKILQSPREGIKNGE